MRVFSSHSFDRKQTQSERKKDLTYTYILQYASEDPFAKQGKSSIFGQKQTRFQLSAASSLTFWLSGENPESSVWRTGKTCARQRNCQWMRPMRFAAALRVRPLSPAPGIIPEPERAHLSAPPLPSLGPQGFPHSSCGWHARRE